MEVQVKVTDNLINKICNIFNFNINNIEVISFDENWISLNVNNNRYYYLNYNEI